MATREYRKFKDWETARVNGAILELLEVIYDGLGLGAVGPSIGQNNAVRFIDENGAAYGIKQISNKPRVSATPYSFDIVEGNIPNHVATTITAEVVGAGTTFTDMWGGAPGTVEAPLLTSAIAMEAVSSSAQDDPTGTGIGTVEIHYLDTNGASQTETVTLDGTNPVALGENVLHIQRIHAASAGSGASAPFVAAGNIDIRASGGGTVYGRIPVTRTYAPRMVFRIPSGFQGFWVDILAFVFAQANNSDAQLQIVANQDPESLAVLPQGLWIPYYVTGGGSGGSAPTPSLQFPLRFSEGAIIKCRVRRTSGSGLADGFITGSGWIES